MRGKLFCSKYICPKKLIGGKSLEAPHELERKRREKWRKNIILVIYKKKSVDFGRCNCN